MGNPQWAHISDYEVTYGTNKYSPVIELMDAAGNIVGKLCIIPDEEKPPTNRLVMEGISTFITICKILKTCSVF